MAAAAEDRTFGGVGEPAVYAVAITPSATDDLPVVSRAIYVGGTGDVTVIMKGGGSVTFSAVPAGAILPIRATRVLATSTATLMLNLY